MKGFVKRLMCVMCVTMLTLTLLNVNIEASASNEVEELATQSFDGFATGPLADQTTESGFSVKNNTGSVTIVEDPSTNDKSALLYGGTVSGATPPILEQSFTPQTTGKMAFNFSVKITEAGSFPEVKLYSSDGTEMMALDMRMGTFALNYNANHPELTKAYNVNTWYNITMLADLDSHTCALYVDNQLIDSGHPLNALKDLSKIRFRPLEWFGEFHFSVNNFRMYHVPSTVAAPFTLYGDLATQNFDGMTTGVQADGTTESGFTVKNNTGSVTIVEDPSTNDKSALLYGGTVSGATPPILEQSFTPQTTGKMAFNFSVKITEAGSFPEVKLYSSDGTEMMALDMHMGIFAFNYNPDHPELTKAYNANTWYNIIILADLDSHTCGLYVDNQLIDSGHSLNASKDLSKICFRPLEWFGEFHFYVNNFRMCHYTTTKIGSSFGNEVVLNEDYDNEYFPSHLFKNSAFTEGVIGADIARDPLDPTNKVLRHTWDSSVGTSAQYNTSYSFPAITSGTFMFETKVYFADFIPSMRLLDLYDSTGGGLFRTSTDRYNNYRVIIGQSGDSTWGQFSPNAGQWYDMKYIIDLDNREFDVYVDELCLVSNVPLEGRLSTGKVDSIFICTYIGSDLLPTTGGISRTYYDDIKVIKLSELTLTNMRIKNGIPDGSTINAVSEITTAMDPWAETSVHNNSANNEDVVLIAAIYRNGEMERVYESKLIVEAGKTAIGSVELTNLPENLSECEIKMFLWKDTTNLIPLSEPKTY